VNLRLAIKQGRRRRSGTVTQPQVDQMFRDALAPDPNPFYLEAFLVNVAVYWMALTIPFGLLMVACAYVGNRFWGLEGNAIGLAIGVFAPTFCIAGAFDAVWRLYFAKAARRRFTAAGENLDAGVRRYLRIARVNDATLLLQFVGATLVSVLVAVS
jgi:hypothetical protein